MARATGRPPRKNELVSAGNGAQFTRHEMVRRPGPGDRHMAVLEVPRRRVIAILILGYGTGLDQVGEVDEDAAGVGALTDRKSVV